MKHVGLNLGCGRDYREGWLNVDVDENVKADACVDVFSNNLELFLGRGWRLVRCANVINYAPSLEHVENFFKQVRGIMCEGGCLELEFMNIANAEGLRLHYFTVQRMLRQAGFECELLTKRHWVTPTGNVKVLATKKEGIA